MGIHMESGITVVHEHSVKMGLLPERANILDLGARGFLFSDHLKNLGHKLYCVDIEDLSWSNEGSDGSYYQMAISDFNGYASIKRTHDPQATSIIKYSHLIPESIKVYTLETFSKNVRVDLWDLIKIDVEGSEYQIIMSLEKAPARQLSIEFHMHTGVYGWYELSLMEDKLKALGYVAVKHEITSEHGAGFNYWDSLFILK